MKKIIFKLILSTVFLSLAAFANDDLSKVVIKATSLTSSLYMLEGAGGNITASIGTDGVLLVDDDFAEMSDRLVTKLKELGGNSPRFIVNNHFHYDHTGGNEAFGSSATIIAATAVRERLMTEQTLWHEKHPPVPTRALPNLTYDQSLTLHLNNDDIRVVHLPHGHTDGDSVVFFEQGKVVSMGDLYFSGMYPIFHPEHDGNLDGYIKDIEFVLKQIPSDAQIVPGHGPLSNKTSLEKYYRMILASISTVKSGIKKKLSLQQIQKNGLDQEWESFSHGYRTTDQWLESVYKSLKK